MLDHCDDFFGIHGHAAHRASGSSPILFSTPLTYILWGLYPVVVILGQASANSSLLYATPVSSILRDLALFSRKATLPIAQRLRYKPSTMKAPAFSVLALIVATASLQATGFFGPDRWLDNGGEAVIHAPEFYWADEVQRLARDFLPTEKRVIKKAKTPDDDTTSAQARTDFRRSRQRRLQRSPGQGLCESRRPSRRDAATRGCS